MGYLACYVPGVGVFVFLFAVLACRFGFVCVVGLFPFALVSSWVPGAFFLALSRCRSLVSVYLGFICLWLGLLFGGFGAAPCFCRGFPFRFRRWGGLVCPSTTVRSWVWAVFLVLSFSGVSVVVGGPIRHDQLFPNFISL